MRPNIIFINVDQMSALDSIGALEAPYVDTPAIDRIFANGRAFGKAFPADPVCCPSRTSWWTGRYPSEHGTPLNDTPCHPDMNEVLLPKYLRQSGVETFFAGKWHVEGCDVREHFHVLHEASYWGELTDRDIASSACAFLDRYDGEKPFFLNLGFMNTHDICISPCNDRGRALNEDESLTLPYVYEGILGDEEIPPLPEAMQFAEPEPHLQWAWNRWARDQDGASQYSDLVWRMHRYNYHRWVEMVDREIGTVLDALEGSRFRDNTWIIFTSDHGEGMSRHEVIGKILFYREIAEVPMVIGTLGEHLPVSKGTTENRYFASGVDIAPTTCAIMGIHDPDYPRGRNLMPLVTGETPNAWREIAYVECAFNARMVTDGHYKYIRDYQVEDEDFRPPGPDTHRIHLEQLFDLTNDPDESRNLVGAPEHAQGLEEMRTQMDRKERLLHRRPMPGEHGRNWVRQKLQLCREQGVIA